MANETTAAIDEETLKIYLDEVQHAQVLADVEDPSKAQEIQEIIEAQLSEARGVKELESFFLAEQAFYQQEYKTALKEYLASKTIPNFHFFCYRTSAFVSESLGRQKKAIDFAHKALETIADDYGTLVLLHRLLRQSQQSDAADSIQRRIDRVVSHHTADDAYTPDGGRELDEDDGQREIVSRPVGLGDQELQELSNLFEDNSEETQAMFENQENSDTTANSASAVLEEEATQSAETSTGTGTASASDSTIDTTPSYGRAEASADATSVAAAITSGRTDPNKAYFGSFGTTSDSNDLGTGSISDATATSRTAIDELKTLAGSNYQIESDSTQRFLTDDLGFNSDSGPTLEQKVNAFQREQIEALSHYVEWANRRPQLDDNVLLVLNGWNYGSDAEANNSNRSSLKHNLLPASYRRTSGGFYIRWKGKGVVVNPGPNFLENFHARGHHIKDIDYVVVTRDCKEAHADVRAIYDLNYRINKMDANLHIINYYLNQQAHRNISMTLKPHFKQERNTVHCLELYVDSPDIESLALGDAITLNYFPTTNVDSSGSFQSKGEVAAKGQACIGIRLELETDELSRMSTGDKSAISVGYVSGTGYSPVLAHHFSGTDVILAAFETTNPDDTSKLQYNSDSLGIFGTQTIIEEVAPRLLVCSEFSGREGDVRVEVAKKLRQESAFSSHQNTTVLPGDTGLCINLENLRVRCSVNGTFVDPRHVHVVKTKQAFGNLQYLSPSCFI